MVGIVARSDAPASERMTCRSAAEDAERPVLRDHAGAWSRAVYYLQVEFF